MIALIFYFCLTVSLSTCFFLFHYLLDWGSKHYPLLQKCIPYKPTIYLIGLTLGWYSVSVSFTIFNKWFLRGWHGGFHYPIFGTAVHMIVKFLFSRVWYYFSDVAIAPLSFKFDFMVVVPIGIVTALDVMFSNQALLYVSVTMYTVLKSSILIWTYLFGLLFKLEECRWSTVASVLMICLGISAAVYSADQRELSMVGVIYCLAAAASGGLRWTMTQLLMKDDPCSSNVMVAIYRFAPSAALSIIPIAMMVDVPKFELDSENGNGDFSFEHPGLLVEAGFLLLCGGLISFLLIGVEVYLLQLTTSLTMGILGQLKEIVQIALAMMVFHDHLDTRGVIGIVVALAGAYLYRESRAGHERNPDSYQDEEEKGPLLFEAKARSNITNREKDQDFDSRYPEVQLTAIS